MRFDIHIVVMNSKDRTFNDVNHTNLTLLLTEIIPYVSE